MLCTVVRELHLEAKAYSQQTWELEYTLIRGKNENQAASCLGAVSKVSFREA